MNADDFVKFVRKGPEKLRVDEILINTGSEELHGKGMIQISREHFTVVVTVKEGGRIPEFRTGTYTKRDSWRMSGIIEDQLAFKCDNVGFPSNTQKSLPDGITRCTFNLHPIDLIPSGWDALTRLEREEFWRQNQQNVPAQNDAPALNDPEVETRDNVYFDATLLDFPLYPSIWGKEIKGETENFDFVLKQVDETSDLYVSLRSKNKYSSLGEQGDWKKFHAFMNALAFMNGMNAWPYRIQYWRAGQKLIDRITPACQLASTIHAPFPNTLAFNARTGSIKWDFQNTLKIITAFFETESPLTDEVAYLLFLFRQAGDRGVHGEITTLTLCALFENLIQHIFRELKLEENARRMNPLFDSFEQAKGKILQQMDLQATPSDPGHKRARDMIRSAEVFNAKFMFQSIASHFGLKWEDDMALIFKTWQSARHPRMHRSVYTTQSEDDLKASFIAESRIAGAINILALKLAGYSGYLRHSAFEDGYRQI